LRSREAYIQLEQADVIWRSQVEREVSLGFRVVHIDKSVVAL